MGPRIAALLSEAARRAEEARLASVASDDPPDRAAGGWTDRIETFIVNQPAAALGAALAVGVVVGWLLKRR